MKKPRKQAMPFVRMKNGTHLKLAAINEYDTHINQEFTPLYKTIERLVDAEIEAKKIKV